MFNGVNTILISGLDVSADWKRGSESHFGHLFKSLVWP